MKLKKIKAVILVAGPQKGTRFRPLSLEVPKPLFPVAGYPLIEHHIAACIQVSCIDEIILLGFYQPNEQITRFIDEMKRKYSINMRYLQEYQPLGTAGGLYHFRDQIIRATTDAIIVIHADIFCMLPLHEMIELYCERNSQSETGCHVVLGTHSNKVQPLAQSQHGNMVINPETNEVAHYVEKPENYVSGVINCGAYVFHPSVKNQLASIYECNQQKAREEEEDDVMFDPDLIFIEKHLFSRLVGNSQLYCCLLENSFWGSMKSAGSAIFANKQYLAVYRKKNLQKELAENNPGKPQIVGDVFIHPTATVDPSAKLGPNVSIGSHCVIGPGARVKESIILDGAELRENSCVLHCIIGWRCLIGAWSRVEGTPQEPSANYPHALVNNESLFHPDGKLIPSITVLGCNVTIPREVIVLNSIVLPHKELSGSYKNQIIL